MNKIDFILSIFLIISISINLLQIIYFRYQYLKIQQIYLKKEKRLLEKNNEQLKEIIALKNKIQIHTIK